MYKTGPFAIEKPRFTFVENAFELLPQNVAIVQHFYDRISF